MAETSMLVLRVISLAVLVYLHVLGGAILFRRIFPRENPWWGFFLPTLIVVTLLNFVEHAVALTALGVLLPFSTIAMVVALIFSRGTWKGMRLPAILLAIVFPFCLWMRCLQPGINFYNTEGLTDMNRILDFCLGDKVPPQDCWLPPFAHTGYYSFMQYGASVLTRLLSVDIGTGYNVGQALTNSLVMLAGAAAAHTLGRFRSAVTILVLVMLMGGFTGSLPIDLLLHPSAPNPVCSIDLGGWDYPNYPEFTWLLKIASPVTAYRIYSPGCYIYYTEFHATIGGHLVALLTVFGVAEVFRRRRGYFSWIWLTVTPLIVFITCTWLIFMVAMLAGPSLVCAWWLGRRPPKWLYAVLGAGAWILLLAPAAMNLLGNSVGQPWAWSEYWMKDIPTSLLQWWPVYLPWIVLCFRWDRLTFVGRWLLFWLVPIAMSVELFFFNERSTMMEKTLSGSYGIAQAVVYPLLFAQRGRLCRGLSLVIVASGLISFGGWTACGVEGTDWDNLFCHLEGDDYIQREPSQVKIEQTLREIHGRTVITGRARHAWFRSPTVVAFSENRCYLGWTNAEEVAGRGAEANAREVEINSFYDGKISDPLEFLNRADAAGVLVWPEDTMSNEWLDAMKQKLGGEFTYIDCRAGDNPANAGVFIRRELLSPATKISN